MWNNKSIDKIFKYFGYDVNRSFSSDEARAKSRDEAIKRMETYGQIPDDVMDKVKSYNDDMVKNELAQRERMEAERRRRAQIAATKISNRDDDVYDDDEYAQAVYQHLVEEGDVEDIDEKVQERDELEKKLKSLKDKFERLEGSKSNDQRVVNMMVNLEINIDAIESEIDELTDDIEENDIYGVLYEQQWTHYGLREFETPNADYAVGTEEESEEAAREYLTQYIDDNGVDGFSSWVVESNIDKDKLIEDLIEAQKEYYEDDVRYDLSSYFDEYDEDDEETHPSEEEIDELIQNLAQERAEDIANDPNELSAYGYDVRDYVDMDGVVADVINSDGIGHTLSMYDGQEHNVQINGTWYNVYRTN